jgi:hypothetical protein
MDCLGDGFIFFSERLAMTMQMLAQRCPNADPKPYKPLVSISKFVVLNP